MEPTKPPVKNINLTPKQGCLMLVGLAVLFGGVFLFIGAGNSSSIDGKVTGEGFALEPFGCTADRVKDDLVIPLRDIEPKEGFHEENRAIVFSDHSDQGETRTARPVEGLTVAYRNETKEVTPIDCEVSQNTLTIQTARRSGSTARRTEDRWNGEFTAECTSAALGALKIELEMKNCD